MSGQSEHFASLEELLAFIARVLATGRAPPQQGPKETSEQSRDKHLPATKQGRTWGSYKNKRQAKFTCKKDTL